MNVERLCHCGFTAGDISNTEFKCFGENPDKVTFRGELSTPLPNVSMSIVLSSLSEWIDSGTRINVGEVALATDPTCNVEIQSLAEQECQPETGNTSHNIAPAVGEGVAVAIVVIVIIIAVVMVVMAIKYYRNRHRYATPFYFIGNQHLCIHS